MQISKVIDTLKASFSAVGVKYSSIEYNTKDFSMPTIKIVVDENMILYIYSQERIAGEVRLEECQTGEEIWDNAFESVWYLAILGNAKDSLSDMIEEKILLPIEESYIFLRIALKTAMFKIEADANDKMIDFLKSRTTIQVKEN